MKNDNDVEGDFFWDINEKKKVTKFLIKKPRIW